MAEIERYRSEDQRATQMLYRRVFGQDAAEASRLRWDWQYRRNPNVPASGPLIWVAREAQTIIGQCATIPVRLSVNGREIDAAWGTDVMVAPERQRQGLGEMLVRTSERAVGASLGLGLSESSSGLYKKLRIPSFGPVPCLVKPLSRRALRRPHWPVPINRLVSALTYPIVRLVARARPLQGEVRNIQQFDESFTRLWERVGPSFAGAVRRDAKYLNWRFIQAPHVRYTVAALYRDGEAAGYVVYRHGQEPRGRATRLIDFFADPRDEEGVLTLLRFVDREAQAADSDKIRVYATHAGFRKLLRKSGYYPWRSSTEFVARITAVDVDAAFYASADGWHITAGDSDQDH
jgi:GNAT superfamily N-acetyltransferase